MGEAAMTAGVKNWTMWFALLGGAVAWSGHLLLAYAIAEFGCVAGWGHAPGSVSIVSWLLIAVSAAMILLAAGALLVSFRIASQAPRVPEGVDRQVTTEYVARFGKIANGLFLFIIVIQSVPIAFYLGRC